MFGKRSIRCKKCDKEVKSKFDFCPYCAAPLKNLREDYGILGKTDDLSELDSQFKTGFAETPSFVDKLVGGVFNSAIKALDKQMQNLAKEEIEMQKEASKMQKQGIDFPKTNLELYINGKRVNLPENISGLQIDKMPAKKQSSEKMHNRQMPKISEETLEKSKKLPRREAKSHITRTSDKIAYELETPGLESLNNVLINKLESSIEIKAFTDKAVFIKTLPVKLQLVKYSLKSDGNLVLEFRA